MSEICRLGAARLSRLIRQGELSALQVARAFLERIEETEPRLRAFLSLEPDSLLAAAKALDRRRTREPGGILALDGVPVAVKDVITTITLPTTCGSRILEGYRSPVEAAVVERLRAAGALIAGKTNCDEFAMGSSTENSAFFPTRNPWDLERVPGGSSGGSAAAVAARQVPLSLGTDTGGSIRQPAAFCGVVGLKPTYGRVSRRGLVAFASSLDQIGPLAANVADAALLLEVIAGPDPGDSTCSARPAEDYLEALGGGVEELRIGVVREWLEQGLDKQVAAGVETAMRASRVLGCSLQEVSLPHSEVALAAYYVIAPAEASSNLARYDGVRYGLRVASDDLSRMLRKTRGRGFGAEVKRRILLGTYALSSGYYEAYFRKASQIRTLICRDYQQLFRQVDLLLGPTTPTPPFRLGEKERDPLQMYLSDVYTVTANLAGIPALSLPCAYTPEGLPLGVQIQAPHFEEARLLRFAAALEEELALEPPPLPL